MRSSLGTYRKKKKVWFSYFFTTLLSSSPGRLLMLAGVHFDIWQTVPVFFSLSEISVARLEFFGLPGSWLLLPIALGMRFFCLCDFGGVSCSTDCSVTLRSHDHLHRNAYTKEFAVYDAASNANAAAKKSCSKRNQNPKNTITIMYQNKCEIWPQFCFCPRLLLWPCSDHQGDVMFSLSQNQQVGKI